MVQSDTVKNKIRQEYTIVAASWTAPIADEIKLNLVIH